MASGYGRRRASVGADPPGYHARGYANELQRQGSHHSQGVSHHIAQREVSDHLDLQTPDFRLRVWHRERQQAARRQGSLQQESQHEPSQRQASHHEPSQHQSSRRASHAGHIHLPSNARIVAIGSLPSNSRIVTLGSLAAGDYEPSQVSRRASSAGNSHHPSNARLIEAGSHQASRHQDSRRASDAGHSQRQSNGLNGVGSYAPSQHQASRHQDSRRASNAGQTHRPSNARLIEAGSHQPSHHQDSRRASNAGYSQRQSNGLNGVGSYAPVNHELNNQLARRATITPRTAGRGLSSLFARPSHEVREVNGRLVQVRPSAAKKEVSRRGSAAGGPSQYQPDREETYAASGYPRSNALVERRSSNAGSSHNSKAVVARRPSNADAGHGLSRLLLSRRQSNAGTQAHHASPATDNSGLLQRFRRASIKSTAQDDHSNKRSREEYEKQHGHATPWHNQHAQHESSKRHKASAPAPPSAPPKRQLRRVKPFTYNGRHSDIRAQKPKVPSFDPTEVYPGYQLVHNLEHGGMSDAVKIVKNRAGKVFVEKRIKMKNAGTVTRAKLEIRVLTRITSSNNPNLNRLKDALWGPQGSHVAMLLEYCDKGNVADYVARKYQDKGNRIPESFLWHVLQGIANGLAYLHEGIENAVVNPKPPRLIEKWNTIYHLDIKTENIFLSSTPAANGPSASYYPRIVIGDFGCSSTDGKGWQAGTPAWDPPEGTERFGKHTDTWMAGAVIHACALGLVTPDRKMLKKDGEHPVGFGYSDRLTTTIRAVTYVNYKTRWNAVRIVDESTRALTHWAM